ncbi:putative tetratricopeptide-like helical domain superfamily [Helianthus debilis subsp. tardiflorus]
MLVKGIVADIYVYTSMISCNCKVGNLKRAFELFDELSERGLVPNVHTYGVLLNGVCKAGEMKVAEVLLSEMKSKGLDVNDVIIKIRKWMGIIRKETLMMR